VNTKGGLGFEDQSKQSKEKAGNKMIKVIRLPRRKRERERERERHTHTHTHTHKSDLQSTNFKTFGTKTDSQYSSLARFYNITTKRHY
jgi:hypothetical protein